MRFYIITALVLVPLLAVLSLILPLVTNVPEKSLGPAFSAQESGTPDAVRGEKLYRSMCYGCHTAEANIGPVHSTMDFKKLYPEDEELATLVRAGRQPMPAFDEEMLTDPELADIIAYLRSLPTP